MLATCAWEVKHEVMIVGICILNVKPQGCAASLAARALQLTEPAPAELKSHATCFSVVQLATGCRQMLKEKRYALPEVNLELVGDFYTILIGFTMEAAEGTPYDPQGEFPSFLLF